MVHSLSFIFLVPFFIFDLFSVETNVIYFFIFLDPTKVFLFLMHRFKPFTFHFAFYIYLLQSFLSQFSYSFSSALFIDHFLTPHFSYLIHYFFILLCLSLIYNKPSQIYLLPLFLSYSHSPSSISYFFVHLKHPFSFLFVILFFW